MKAKKNSTNKMNQSEIEFDWGQLFKSDREARKRMKEYELMPCKKHGLSNHFLAADPGGEINRYVRACVLCGQITRIKPKALKAFLDKM